MYGYRRDYSGTILFDDRDIRELSVGEWSGLRCRSLAMMFQGLRLFPELSAVDNVRLKNNLTGRRSEAEIAWLFEALGIAEKRETPVSKLSFGQQQRVALARALATSPRILLMDEPFAALDAMTREQLYQDIQEIHLRCGMTIVFVTHNMREAVCLGDRVVLLTPHPGRVCEEYFVDFPHPRDINSSDLAALSARITRDLKGATA